MQRTGCASTGCLLGHEVKVSPPCMDMLRGPKGAHPMMHGPGGPGMGGPPMMGGPMMGGPMMMGGPGGPGMDIEMTGSMLSPFEMLREVFGGAAFELAVPFDFIVDVTFEAPDGEVFELASSEVDFESDEAEDYEDEDPESFLSSSEGLSVVDAASPWDALASFLPEQVASLIRFASAEEERSVDRMRSAPPEEEGPGGHPCAVEIRAFCAHAETNDDVLTCLKGNIEQVSHPVESGASPPWGRRSTAHPGLPEGLERPWACRSAALAG